ncbi:uncharacterized protein YfaS (alpha-2-macroglobulin family) [Chitinophaga skermanii]|uniref:Uncharacterized protein YfaS (Alpha-2-macroglobulin family) n=1 Tax=Chitinophaga skermanii TaxID=331697 RepID=A0A327R4I7_9BACT|nr:MG2 domain-containing protein [Chitinophaga skermanii]RAJ10643.1 uncharacterized protein YfaS (alpha-2-macroglobulin family) [Chitinophaga skermanii]
MQRLVLFLLLLFTCHVKAQKPIPKQVDTSFNFFEKQYLQLIQKKDTTAAFKVLLDKLVNGYRTNKSYSKDILRTTKYINQYDSIRKAILNAAQAVHFLELGMTGGYTLNQKFYTKEALFDSAFAVGSAFERDSEVLLNTKIEAYAKELDAEQFPSIYRPSLYDLFAQRLLVLYSAAIATIERIDTVAISPSNMVLAPSTVFVNTTFSSKAPHDIRIQQIRLFQTLTKRYISSSNIDALRHLEFQRAKMLYESRTNKRHIIENGIRDMLTFKLSLLDSTMQSQTALAETYLEVAQELNNNFDSHDEQSLLQQLHYVNQAIKLAPNSWISERALALKYDLEYKELDVKIEAVQRPHTPILTLVTFRNIEKVQCKIERFPLVGKGKSTIVSKWEQALPKAVEHTSYSTEIPLEGLPVGNYRLTISAATYEGKVGTTSVDFQVSNLFPVYLGNNKVAVLDRTTGLPVTNVNIEAWKKNKLLRKLGKTTTEGSVIPVFSIYGSWTHLFIKGRDSLLLQPGDAFVSVHSDRREKRRQQRIFVYTDRSIYRPNQRVFFKGFIGAESASDWDNFKPVTKDSVAVRLLNDRSEEVAELYIKPNTFGSFSGYFDVKESYGTGEFEIETDIDPESEYYNVTATRFNVEEYKRPRFKLAFTGYDKEVKLHHTSLLPGNALTLAGTPVSHASVQAQLQYTWRFSDSIKHTSDYIHDTVQFNTVTDTLGNFIIPIHAIKIDTSKGLLESAYLQLYVTVTDQNGESHELDKSISISDETARMYFVYGSEVSVEHVHKSPFVLKTNSDKLLPYPIQVKIYQLTPGNFETHKRAWNPPSLYFMDSITFLQKFPGYDYKYGTQQSNWPAKLYKELTVYNNDSTALRGLPPGYYKFVATSQDEYGQPLEYEGYSKLYDYNANEAPSSNWIQLGVHPFKPIYQVGDTITFRVIMTPNVLYYLALQQSSYGYLTSQSIWSKGDVNEVKYSITEKDLGGKTLGVLGVKDGRVFSRNVFIYVEPKQAPLAISFHTFRDKLLPGQHEQWKIKVEAKAQALPAEITATMYDASIDEMLRHRWELPNFKDETRTYTVNQFQYLYPKNNHYSSYSEKFIRYKYLQFAGYLNTLRNIHQYEGDALNFAGGMKRESLTAAVAAMAPPNFAVASVLDQIVEKPILSIRQNFNETAFFIAHQQSNEKGEIVLDFDLPGSVTTWRFKAFAGNKQLTFSNFLQADVISQKKLMVQPNAPRFVRIGDDLKISVNYINNTDSTLSVKAGMEYINPKTNQPFEEFYKVQTIQLQPFESKVLHFTLQVRENMEQAIIYRAMGDAGTISDGEQNIIPVLPRSTALSETLPIGMKGDGEKTFVFESLQHSDTSNTLQNRLLNIEYTASPIWTVVRALGDLREYQHDCTEQLMSKYSANALALSLLQEYPQIAKTIAAWKATAKKDVLDSLSSLRHILFAQSPWLLDEAAKQKQLFGLLDQVKVKATLVDIREKITARQTREGGFSWYGGDGADMYITIEILQQIAQLKRLTKDASFNELLARAIQYLDQQFANSKTPRPIDQYRTILPVHNNIQYLLLRDEYPQYTMVDSIKTWKKKYTEELRVTWQKYPLYDQLALALYFKRNGDLQVANNIIRALTSKAEVDDSLQTMYWKDVPMNYFDHSNIETQTLALRAFAELGKNEQHVLYLKNWLLRHKDNNNWETTKATAGACYALLSTSGKWMDAQPNITITTNNHVITSSAYELVESITPKEFNHKNANIKLQVKGSNGQPSWGNVNWKYSEDLLKLKATSTGPITIDKQYFIATPGGNIAQNKAIQPGEVLEVGQQVVTRIKIKVTASLSYLLVEDVRAACFEPKNVLSGYNYLGNMQYYEVTKDVSSNYYINNLTPGEYTIEHTSSVTHRGEFTAGPVKVTCMYDPAIAAHSAAGVLKVK